jgi:hypothetical protein
MDISQQVEMLKQTCPEKYKKFQKIGESFMEMKYDLKPGEDWDGDPIKANLLLKQIIDYNLLDDLVDEEISLLERVYGKEWRKLICDIPNPQD